MGSIHAENITVCVCGGGVPRTVVLQKQDAHSGRLVGRNDYPESYVSLDTIVSE